MSRSLPVVGSARTAVTASLASSGIARCVAVDGVVRVAVIEARTDLGGHEFTATLVSQIEGRGRVATVATSEVVPDSALVVLLGMDTPRPRRTAFAQASWARADVLLCASSELVARSLASAL